jgi:L-aspartate oxidase
MAMAYFAGAEMADMEFVQFHPTALNLENAPRFLLSEAMRGEGGILRNAQGERFMSRLRRTLGTCAARCRFALDCRRNAPHRNAHVFLDMTAHSEEFLKRTFSENL